MKLLIQTIEASTENRLQCWGMKVVCPLYREVRLLRVKLSLIIINKYEMHINKCVCEFKNMQKIRHAYYNVYIEYI